jgi:hypothetical protein
MCLICFSVLCGVYSNGEGGGGQVGEEEEEPDNQERTGWRRTSPKEDRLDMGLKEAPKQTSSMRVMDTVGYARKE